MKKLLTVGLAAGLVAGYLIPAKAEVSPKAAEVMATTCFGCHGSEGKTANKNGYSIAGKPAKVIEMDLKAYKEDKKKGTIMNRIAKGYSDEELTAIAQYISSLK